MMRIENRSSRWTRYLGTGLTILGGFFCAGSSRDLRSSALPMLDGTDGKGVLAVGNGEAWPLAVDSITAEGIRRHIEVLAADAMEGRETGSAGYERASGYVAHEFEAIGLAPAGDGDRFFQTIPLFETRLVPESASMGLRRDQTIVELEFRSDFIAFGGYGPEHEEVEAPLAFVGYGVKAPEYGHDDFADIDVSGKILVMLSGAPPYFATDQRAYYSSGLVKRDLAVELGAVGYVVVRTPVDQERRPWARYLPGIGSPEMCWVDSDGRPFEGFLQLQGTAVLSQSGAEKLFTLAGYDLAAIFEKHTKGQLGNPVVGSFDMDVTATLAQSSKQRRVRSANVLGLLAGSDPSRRDEFVIYTAHLDHLGIRPGENGDEIHNGMYDNAAGVAVILEVARAMASLTPAPRRSILFAALAGEEQGLKGSSFLAHHPPVPIEMLVANLNVDMPYLGFPIANLEAFGAEHSTLESAVRRATAAVGIALTPDSMPERVRFVRSDQFSFVQRGIPALALKPGSESADPAIDGGAMLSDFLSHHYHQPSDDLALPFDAAGAESFARAALLTGLLVAESDDRPRWNDGDFFGTKFGREE